MQTQDATRGAVSGVSLPAPRGWALRVGLAALIGCAACCALPMLGLLGLGGGAAASAAGLLGARWELVLGAGGFGVALSLMMIRARMRARASAGDACSDACGVYRSPSAPPDEPIVCTADTSRATAIQAQMDGYRAAFEHLAASERFPGGFRWRFRAQPGLDAALETLARHEHECCRFMAFNVFRQGEEIVWETRAAEGAASVVEEYFHLPQRLRALPNDGQGLATLKKMAERSGLKFSRDCC